MISGLAGSRSAWSRGSKAIPELDCKRHGVKITSVGVEVLEVYEQAFVVDEVRAGVPGRDMQLDQAIPRHPESHDVVDARARVIAEIARWRHADQPFFAAERAQALRDPSMPRDPGEAETDMRQVHDPQPRLDIPQHELCLVCRRLGIVAALAALATRPQWRDDLPIWCKRIGRQLADVQHVRW